MDLVLIPAYEPDKELITLAERLVDEGFSVLVVDDGSGDRYADIFEAVRQNATVLTLSKNRGKGAALKAGMRYIRENMPDCEHFITCDADGQHRVEDVMRVRERLHKGDHFVLTVRHAKTKVPLRSKVGNCLSRYVYTLLANRYLTDNQSGLRGFSRIHIDWLIKVEKDNYDYEMNVLYYASKKNIRISTLPIEAIYIGNNESSHFNPIKDTVRIYKSLFWLARGTFLAFALSEILVMVVSIIFGYQYLHITLPSVAAISFLTQFLLNRYVCFRGTPCYDFLSSMAYTIISYFLYTMDCMLLMYATDGQMPLWLAFNLAFLTFIPLRYLLHKLIAIASTPRE